MNSVAQINKPHGSDTNMKDKYKQTNPLKYSRFLNSFRPSFAVKHWAEIRGQRNVWFYWRKVNRQISRSKARRVQWGPEGSHAIFFSVHISLFIPRSTIFFPHSFIWLVIMRGRNGSWKFRLPCSCKFYFISNEKSHYAPLGERRCRNIEWSAKHDFFMFNLFNLFNVYKACDRST